MAFFVVPAKTEYFGKSFFRCLEILSPRCIFAAKEREKMAYRIEDMKHPPHCLFCGCVLPSGRPDRKFCSRACKNRWHNRVKHPSREQVERRVMRVLSRNHVILEKLLRLGIHQIDRLTLLELGYHPDYVTSYRKTGVHHQYTCFDIRYELTPTRIKNIVRTVLEDDADKMEPEEEYAV